MTRAIIFCIFFFFAHDLYAQVAPGGDTLREIEIIKGRSLREKTVDSLTRLQTIAGDVILKEGNTLFICDSAIINQRLNTIEAFGNIHINQSDSMHAYSQYMRYMGNERIAYMQKNVRLTDKKGTLFTEELEYNLGTGIGIYNRNGRVVNGKTVLTSTSGTYFSDTKDIFFRNNVRLVNPTDTITADSMQYNTLTEVATFIGPTNIKGKDFKIYTTSGFYNMKTGEALFDQRSLFKDSVRTFIADHTAFDDKSGIAQLEGNAVVKDSAGGYTVLGNQIFLNKKNNSFLATRKPVLIIKHENDSTYIAADTLYSGFRLNNSKIDSVKITDTLRTDSTINTASLKNKKSKTPQDSSRYFQAFHHVRIYNDSLQSVCDSLFYSAKDSVFRLYNEPVVWNGKSQITGDTIYMFTKNQKAERLYIFDHGMVISKSKGTFYNQVSGRTMNAYFTEGKINTMKVKGSPSESIYFIQDEDSAYVGMNRATGDVIDILFINAEINKVRYINDVKGILHPIRQVTEDIKYLRGFNWLDKRRPKNKAELFE
ncbi:OstA-like protein [soil metagenome]